jgi:ADP-heptose:LPS heptosyltransferase
MRKPYILVVRQLGGVGDVLSLSCVARGLREKYPDHRLVYVTSNLYLGGGLLDIANHNPLWSEVIVVEPWDETGKQTKLTWAKYFSPATPEIEEDLLWKMADHAFDLNASCVLKEWPEMNSPGGVITPRYVAWCDACGITEPSSYAPIYRITDQERKAAKEYTVKHWAGKTVIGVGLSACDKKRALGIGKLTEICTSLAAEGLHPVTIDPTCTIPGVDYLINKRIRDLMPLIEQMRVIVTVDSGTLHMAGALGVPVVGIFGPTDYKMRMNNYLGGATDSRQLVDCAPCFYKFPCDSGKAFHHKPFECLRRIAVTGIVEETLRWVEYRRKTGTK